MLHCLSVQFGRLGCLPGIPSSPEQLEPVLDLRQRSPSRRVELFTHYNDLAD